jgi:predicted enzyme related to lactoylglutathione lyase
MGGNRPGRGGAGGARIPYVAVDNLDMAVGKAVDLGGAVIRTR